MAEHHATTPTPRRRAARDLALTVTILTVLAVAGAPSQAEEAIDWRDRDRVDVPLAGDWRLVGCEGEAPLLCAVDAHGEVRGTLLLGVYELWPEEETSAEAVRTEVADFHEVFAEDRRDTCGDDFRYEAHPLEPASVGGHDGYRYGFTLLDGQGDVHEEVVLHLAFAAGLRLVINTSFTDPEGCPGRDHERAEFDVADLEVVIPHLDRVASRSVLPTDLSIGPACPPGLTPPAGFGDTEDNVHAGSIDCLAWHRLTVGTAPGTYRPAEPVTRGQFATMLGRLLEHAQHQLPDATDQGFTDVAGSTHAEAINRLAAAGIVHGRTATSFAPSRPVTRAQATALVVRAYEFHQQRGLYDDELVFSDVSGVHATVISRAATAGLVEGRGDGSFSPDTSVRRDQAASLVTRMLNRMSLTSWIPRPA